MKSEGNGRSPSIQSKGSTGSYASAQLVEDVPRFDGKIRSNVNSIFIRYLPAFISKRLDGRHVLQKAITNTGWLLADKVVRLLVGLGVGIWIARFLGPEQFGMLSYAVAFVSLLGVLATLGLDGTVVRELVRAPEQKNEILGATFLAKFLGGILTLLLAVIAIQFLRPADFQVRWLIAIIAAGTTFQSFDVIDFWFQSRVESRFAVYAKSSAFLLVALVKIALILNNAPLSAFAFAASLEILLGAAGLIIAYRMTGHSLLRWRVKAQRIRQLVSEAWPLALSSTAVLVYMRIDQIMLGEMVGDREVGVYGAAIRFSEVWYFIPVSIIVSLAPSLVELRRVNVDLYYERFSNLFRLMTGIALAISIPVTFASGYLARTAYGNSYEGVAQVLAIHIWATPFVFLGVAQSPWNLNEGLTRLALFRTVSGAVANILLNFLLIPKYGAAGAAVATAISYALAAVFLNAFSKRTRRIFFLQLKSILVVPSRI